MRLRREQADEAARIARIEQSAPPLSTFDGQLARFREQRKEDAEYETVWDGTKGRQGASLSSY